MTAVAARADERALATLVDRHGERLYAFLARTTGDPVEAEDLVQETWIRIARAAPRFDPRRRFRPWAYGIAANLARDLHRRRRVRRERTPEPATDPAPTTPGPVERLDLRERLARLPGRLHEVIVLRYVEGFDEAETAAALGIPRGTVKSRLHAALRALRAEESTT